MFDVIKEILIQLVSIANYREAKKRELFERHIDPLFQLMLQIQKNYREIFTDLNLKLSREKLTKKEIITSLDGKRNELSDVRRLAYSIAHSLEPFFKNPTLLSSKQSRELMNNIKVFSEIIIVYFTVTRGSGSASYTLIERLKKILKDYNDEDIVSIDDEAKKIVSEIVSHIDACWKVLCDLYAKIKIHCL